MNNIKEPNYYLNKAIKDIDFILLHTKDYNKEELEKNEILLDSVLFRLIQISENIHKLPEDFKKEHDTIPWKEISGFRNRIVHDYGNVDIRVVYYVIANDLPQLKYLFEKLIVQ